MGSELLEAFRHSAWANRQLLGCCGGLMPAQLLTSLPTGAGTPMALLKHIIGADSYYLSLIRGARLEWEWDEERDYTPEELLPYVDQLATVWDATLSGAFDSERMLETRNTRMKAGILVAQALHHANVHREQVSAIITSLGLAPPDISGYGYGRTTGGIVPK